MRTRVPILAYILTVAILLVVVSSPAEAKKKTKITIEPGPTTISPAEVAIQADPAAGIEHAVILLEETVRNEDLGTEMQTTYHLRAKILSNEGRDLANIELPYVVGDSRLRVWWARTIQSDGTVLELTADNIEEQFLGSVGRHEVRARKAALPGVEPGAIIDYGYKIRESGYIPIDVVELHKRWYVKELRYRWEPFQYLPGAYAVSGPKDVELNIEQDKRSVLITARDLPPVPAEQFMPPRHETHSAVILYYIDEGKDPKNFWDVEAKRQERRLRADIKKNRSHVENGLAGCADKGTAAERLRAAYAWVQKSGVTGRDADSVYAGVARALGAEARLVMASDRRVRFWDPGLKRMDQFDTLVVAVSFGVEGGAVLVDPSTTLGFGELPWWVTGGNGFVATEKGAKSIFLSPSEARNNIAATDVHIAFQDDGEVREVAWTTKGQGQVGLMETRMLKKMPEDSRQDFLDDLCGVGGDVEIVRAEVIGLEQPGAEYELACEIEWFDMPTSDYDVYRSSVRGPWIGRVPDLPEDQRTHAVVFDYPRVDVAHVFLEAPPGFTTGQSPEPRRLESPYGRYQMSVTKKDNGFLVERAFALVPLTVPATEYEALREFLSGVHVADETPLEFVRDGGQP